MLFSYRVGKAHDGLQYTHRYEADDDRHRDDNERLDQFLDRIDGSFYILIVEISKLQDDRVKLCRLLSDLYHLDKHFREEGIVLKALSDLDSLSDVFPQEEDPLLIDFVSYDIRHDTERLHDGYSTRKQIREHPCEFR